MPTFFAPILPNASGLGLGSASQPWAVFATSVSFQSLLSQTANAASAGLLRLANADLIEWRNAANTLNLTLGPSGVAAAPFDADLLSYSGAGIRAAEFVSPTLPATVGLLRLSDGEVIAWRNHANSGNVSIVHNTDDTLTFPNSTIPVLTSTTVNATTVATPTVQPSGTSGTQLNLIGGAGTTNGGSILLDGTPGTSAGGSVSISAGSGAANNAGSLILNAGSISGGGTGGGFTLTAGTGTSVNGIGTLVAPGGIKFANALTQYAGVAVFGQGVPSEVATIDLLAQTAAITTATLFTPTATGWFRLSSYLKITTAGTSPVLGPVTVGFTDGTDSVAQSIIMAGQTQAGVTQATGNVGNTTASVLIGRLEFFAKTGVAITYAVALTGTVGAGQFAARLRLEAL